jgi:DNA polymerase elongation subunit (family B)
MIGMYIASEARIIWMKLYLEIRKRKLKVKYGDTDSFHINGRVDDLVGPNLGDLKYEGVYNESVYLGKKQYFLKNSSTGVEKVGGKGYSCKLTYDDFLEASKGLVKEVEVSRFSKFNRIRKVVEFKKFGKSYGKTKFSESGLRLPMFLKMAV